MKILASIYAESTDPNKRDKAKEYLKKVTQHDAHDIDSWIQLAEILEGGDAQGRAELLRHFLHSLSQVRWTRT